MNLQDVANLTIPDGEVKTIHDKNRKLLWGRLSYDTTYRGDTFQQTYSGKNLVDFTTVAYDGANSGTGTRDGGTYTVTGNSSDRWGGIYFGQSEINLETNTTYTFSATVVSTTNPNGSMVLANRWCTDAGTAVGGSVVQAGERSFVTFTTPASFNGTPDVRLLPYEKNTTAVFTDLMLEKGATLSPYEPYTGKVPAPNPDYPQAVQTVTGEQTVTVDDGINTHSYPIDLVSKNLMNYSTYDAANGRIMNMPDLVLPIGTFTISFDLESFTLGTSNDAKIYLQLYDENGNGSYSGGTNSQSIYTIDSSTQTGRYSYTFTTIAISHYSSNNIRLGSLEYSNGARCKIANIQIESGSTPTAYVSYFTSIELCKIGDYQDYIYKSGDDWYVHKTCGKVVLDGSSDEEWTVTNSGQANFFYRYRFINYDTSSPLGVSNNFVYADIVNATTNPGFMFINNNQVRFRPNFAELSVADWRTWLSTHNTTVYYPLATPTDTKITDNTLIGQLNAIHQFLTRYGYDFDISGNLPIIINQRGLN